MEINDFFHGSILNAVDAKGRVSLPATFRAVIDRRARRNALPGEKPDDKIVIIGQHEKHRCLQAFDSTYSRKLYEKIEARVAGLDNVDVMEALDEAQLEAFGTMNDVGYDGGGRMVLSPMLRSIAGIGDLAYFVAAGETFQIWDPAAFRAAYDGKPRILGPLEHQLAERGGKS